MKFFHTIISILQTHNGLNLLKINV